MDHKPPWESTVVKSAVTFSKWFQGKEKRYRKKKNLSCENCDDKGFEGEMK